MRGWVCHGAISCLWSCDPGLGTKHPNNLVAKGRVRVSRMRKDWNSAFFLLLLLSAKPEVHFLIRWIYYLTQSSFETSSLLSSILVSYVKYTTTVFNLLVWIKLFISNLNEKKKDTKRCKKIQKFIISAIWSRRNSWLNIQKQIEWNIW